MSEKKKKNYAVMRTQKLKTYSQIAGVGNHNHRLKHTANADPELSKNNQFSDNNSKVVEKVKQRIGDRKVRKNAVLAVEVLLSFSGGSNITDLGEWKKSSVQWLKDEFGEDNLVDWTLHLDETTPHMHAIVVPIDKRDKLSCRSFLNGKKALSDMQTSYAKKVEKYGLKRGEKNSKAHHTSIKKYYGKTNKVRKVAKKASTQLYLAKKKYAEADRKEKRAKAFNQKTEKALKQFYKYRFLEPNRIKEDEAVKHLEEVEESFNAEPVPEPKKAPERASQSHRETKEPKPRVSSARPSPWPDMSTRSRPKPF